MVDGQERLTLGRDPTSAAYARRRVRGFCADLSPDLQAVAQLLTSELVTNALRHGEGAIAMTMTVDSSELRVEVADDSPYPPRRTHAPLDGTGGRGVLLVERLASSWGTIPHPGDGKAVWFTLRRD
jgi:anti-sigma regulatory factor (Ser/Thr protein kinase)